MKLKLKNSKLIKLAPDHMEYYQHRSKTAPWLETRAFFLDGRIRRACLGSYTAATYATKGVALTEDLCRK